MVIVGSESPNIIGVNHCIHSKNRQREGYALPLQVLKTSVYFCEKMFFPVFANYTSTTKPETTELILKYWINACLSLFIRTHRLKIVKIAGNSNSKSPLKEHKDSLLNLDLAFLPSNLKIFLLSVSVTTVFCISI